MAFDVWDSGAAAHRRPASLRLYAAALALCGSLLFAGAAGAQQRPIHVHLWVAGRVIPLTTSAVWTGRDTYIPLAALPAIGARGSISSSGDGVRVRLRSGRVDVLPFVRRNGVALISLTDLAESANASVIKPSATPSAGLKPETAYLLARITDVHLRSNDLHVTTSFPVPFASNTLPGGAGRGYVDCIGATVTQDFRPVRLPATERRAERIRIGQFSPNIARVVVELAPGVTFERNSTEGKVTPTFMAALERGAGTNRVAGGARLHTAGTARSQVALSTHRSRLSQTTIPEDWADSSTGAVKSPRRRVRTSTDEDAPPAKRIKPFEPESPSETISTPRPPRVADIQSIAYETQDNESIRIVIATSRKARAYVRYSAAARQVIVDIPNSRLNLDDERQKEQDIQHPLIEGLSAATVQNSPRLPPLTRLTIDAPHIVSTSVESDAGRIILEIASPRSGRNSRPASGGTIHRLVVVDPGHGGALTGANVRVHKHNLYEKDIALAIAGRLKAALQSRGARVVMTRRTDVNVPLEDRPRIANEVGADVFISIHNDSWGKSNAISGTTAYYHANSPESLRLARCVQQEIAAVSGLRNRGAMPDTNMYPVGFCVLRNTSMPAVLCELGYLNNSKDRSRLVDPGYQQRVAEAVCNGIRNYVSGGVKTARRHSRKQAAV